MVYELIKEQPSQPKGWDTTVDDYLTRHDINYTSATPLQGGYSAYVWRVDGYQDPSSKKQRREPCVLKYADEAAKRVPKMALDSKRMRFEARALNSEPVKSACQAEPNVEVPEVLRTTDRALLMTWGGEMSLREALESGHHIDAAKIGSRLGRWLACLHEAGMNDSEAAGWENSTFMDPVKAGEYERLRTSMLASGFEGTAVDKAIEQIETPVATETVTAWDFRPSNTLLRVKDHPDGEPGLYVFRELPKTYGRQC
jgi:hypothetical protein